MLNDQPDRENILVQLRRERGLTAAAITACRSSILNRLVLQSGLSLGFGRLAVIVCVIVRSRLSPA